MNISFSVAPRCILCESPFGESHSSYPGGQWLPGAFVNPARNCLSLNCKRSLDDMVVIWRDEGYDDLPLQRMTLREFCAEVWYATFDPIWFVLLKSLVMCYN
jgi:hypothetical protein